MKIYFTLLLSLCMFGLQAQNDKGWTKYKAPKLIDASNARKVKRFKNKPASLVTYFYAAKIRQDNKWQKVLPKNRSERLRRKLKEYEEWKFTKFKLVSKKEYEPGKMWVKIFMEIEYKGRKDSGMDEVTLERVKGKWIIVSIPT